MTEENTPAEEPTTPPASTGKKKVAKKVPAKKPIVRNDPKRAEELLADWNAQKAAKTKRREERDLDEWQYFLQCDECKQPGIWLEGNLHGLMIHDDNWWSTYKSLDEAYPDHPHCQVCEQKRGKIVKLLLVPVLRNQMGDRRGRGWRCNGKWAGHLLALAKSPEVRARTPIKRAAPKKSKEPHLTPITHED